jgi:hypothetical protein
VVPDLHELRILGRRVQWWGYEACDGSGLGDQAEGSRLLVLELDELVV